MKVLSVVVPIYNEEQIIDELYRRIVETVKEITDDYEIIFVNDGSTDQSFVKLTDISSENNRVFYIDFSRNFGHQIAITAGIDMSQGQAVVVIDGDLQDPPELILEMYSKYKAGVDVVYARRNKRNGESVFKKITAKVFYRLLKAITSIEIPVDVGDYRLMDRKVIAYLKRMPEQNKFIRGQIAWLGFKSDVVYFDRDERKFGKTGYSFKKMLKFAMDGITSFSDKPLNLVSRLGILFSIVSLGIILYALYSHFMLNRTITGWTSLIISSTFFGGVQLLSIGLIGQYISRINKNTLNRPLYIINHSNISSDNETTVFDYKQPKG